MNTHRWIVGFLYQIVVAISGVLVLTFLFQFLQTRRWSLLILVALYVFCARVYWTLWMRT